MHSGKEAIVLIHGSDSKQRDSGRELLTEGLLKVPEDVVVTQQGPITIQGASGLQLQVTRHEDRSTRSLDVYEAFWADLIPSLTRMGLKDRVLGGLELLAYWLFSGVWKGFRQRKVLTTSIVSGLVLLLFWYTSTLILFFSALKQDPTFPAMALPDTTVRSANSMLRHLADVVAPAASTLGSWKGWVLLSLLMGALPVHRAVDVANLVHRYLTDKLMRNGVVGLRTDLRHRVHATLRAVVESGAYSRVTVVAHSFGAAMAVDVLADFRSSSSTAIRLVTLGGPLELLARRAEWFEKEIQRCADNGQLIQWIDFHSDEDWFCTKTPFRADDTRLIHRPIQQKASLGARMSGETHNRYLGDARVLQALLEPMPAPASEAPAAAPVSPRAA
ncbi:hypothetical protein JYK02_07225 [Corallococcus macrosporus]|uniref:Fungal lipase-type domain-containing protein n=1 Tax=Corallococcus macrosporus TaxID=35 RepID=A0ABS3D6K2_9BACT|nr:hypothetical protein [Corallococcus macrosporus]MBN8227300.1 hypothetical protein [Corallococcus macrosporus]